MGMTMLLVDHKMLHTKIVFLYFSGVFANC